MANFTKIGYCDSSVNPTMGCDGCPLWNRKMNIKKCFAGKGHELRSKHPGFAPVFEQVTLFPGRMEEVARRADSGHSNPSAWTT